MKTIKPVSNKTKINKHFKNVYYNIQPGISKKKRMESINDRENCYSLADRELKDFHREGTKLMKKLSKIIGRVEKSDPYSSVFVQRAAEFMMADWLNDINTCVEYGIISK